MKENNKVKSLFKNKRYFHFYDFAFGRIAKDGSEFAGISLLNFFPVAITKRIDFVDLPQEKSEDYWNDDYWYYFAGYSSKTPYFDESQFFYYVNYCDENDDD